MKYSVVIALFAISAPNCFSQEERWDDTFFGFRVEKPERGRLWVVTHVVANTEGAKFKVGDEILSLNGTNVTTAVDLPQMLGEAADPIEIRAKRKVDPEDKRSRSVVDTATFTRSTRWDVLRKRFDVDVDKLNGIERWTFNAGKLMDNETNFQPVLVFTGDEPSSMFLRFQYRAKDWLFIDRITFTHGEHAIEVSKSWLTDMKHDVLSGGIREWCAITGDDATRIIDAVAEDVDAEEVIRLHGKDYYKDIELSELERIMMSEAKAMFELGKQRAADLKSLPNTATENVPEFLKRQFVGRWTIFTEDGTTPSSYMTLTSDFTAKKDHAPKEEAQWEIVGDECRMTWSDGFLVAIRSEGKGFIVTSRKPGTTWDDDPYLTLSAAKK